MKQFFFTLFILFCPLFLSSNSFVIVLDQGTYCQTTLHQEALDCVQCLQKKLSNVFPQAHIVVSGTSQETSDTLQIASFSNRITAHLHISFNFFTESTFTKAMVNSSSQKGSSKEIIKNIRIYTCLTPVGMQKKSNKLALIPVEKAYEQHAQESKIYAQHFFTTTKNGSFPVFEPKELPLKTLQGVTAPSFLIEIGIGKSKEWKTYFPQLFEGLKEVIASAMENK